MAEQYLKKGSKVYIEGSLQTRKWQDQSGNDRYSTEVVIQGFSGQLTMLDSRGGGAGAGTSAGMQDNSQSGYSSGSPTGGSSGTSNGGGFNKEIDDEIPF